MCGIAGILSGGDAPIQAETIRRMRDAIRHRGPDDAGTEILPEDGVALAHVRLSILDLSAAGHQPMWNEARTVAVVYNGEIYNFRDLRRELEALGKVFRSHCDTEVLVKGYEAWGQGLVNRLNGMFAFALWDKSRKSLWLVRDRLGVKPLYYWQDRERGLFLFASEIKAILQHPAVERAVDPEGLQGYLSLGYVPAPHTMFKGIRKLPPGHQMVVHRKGAAAPARWWEVPPIAPREPHSPEAAKERIRELFADAVGRRLVSDVPLGAFLSGGVDSTLVVGMMSRLMKEPVRTFSAAFDVGPRSFKYNADADAAEEVASRFGTRHTRLVIPIQSDLLGHIVRSVASMDEPHGNPTVVTTLLLAEKVKREGVSVVLSGDGSDEIFGGYSRYQADMRVDQVRRVPRFLRRMAPAGLLRKTRLAPLAAALEKAELAPFTPARLMTWWGLFEPGLQRDILAGEYAKPWNTAESAMAGVIARARSLGMTSNQDAMLLADLGIYLPEENNMRMDKTTMAVALEARAPFLDFQLVEFAMSLPFDRKASLGKEKMLLKSAFPDLLPDSVARRAKWGWYSPVHYWIKENLWEQAAALVADLPRTGIFGPGVAQLVADRRTADPWKVWMLMVFALWHREFIEQAPTPDAVAVGSGAGALGKIHA